MSERIGCDFCIHINKDWRSEEPCIKCNADNQDFNMFEDYKEYLVKHDELVKEIQRLKKENEKLKEETERYKFYASKCGYFR